MKFEGKKLGEMSKSELLRELGRWMKKVDDQQKQIVESREKIKNHEASTQQIARLLDAILVEVVRKFGTEVGEETFEAHIPIPKVEDNPKYILLTAKNDKDCTYALRIERVKIKQNADVKLPN